MTKIKEVKVKKEKVKKEKKMKEAISLDSFDISRNHFPEICTEEEIRIKANEIYEYRMEMGIIGSPEDDWYDAERYFSR